MPLNNNGNSSYLVSRFLVSDFHSIYDVRYINIAYRTEFTAVRARSLAKASLNNII